MRTIGLLLLTLLLTGCVRRELTVTSDPAGALVYLNGREAGRTPFTTDFTYYGNYDVQLRREGTEPLVTSKKIIAPWWQWFPFDFFAELAPWRPVDKQAMHFQLEPKKPIDSKALIERADELKEQLDAPKK
ncbi:MAG TPA: PEGA domain-containing protein [Tepidisphaeraceae bacterium]|nr:PEGA domain-containing protein [Tepidisphaeraceae bacterium]